MTKRSSFRISPEIIRLAVMLCVRLPLLLRNVEDLLHERGIEVSHETVWSGPMFAAEIRKRRVNWAGASVRVYLACGVTDMRKSIEGLAALAQDHLCQKPTGGAVLCVPWQTR